jgi:hypothetical protein
MNLYSQFKTNANLEIDGIWIEYGINDKGKPIRIKIARAGGNNKAFTKAMERVTRPYRRAIQSGTLSNEVAEKLYREAFAETVVLGWENVEGPNGVALMFTKDNAVQLFNDLPDLFVDLRDQASQAALFREEVMEADLGNFGQSLNTASTKD